MVWLLKLKQSSNKFNENYLPKFKQFKYYLKENYIFSQIFRQKKKVSNSLSLILLTVK